MNSFTRKIKLPNWALLAYVALGALGALSSNVAIGYGWSRIAFAAFMLGGITLNSYRRYRRDPKPLND